MKREIISQILLNLINENTTIDFFSVIYLKVVRDKRINIDEIIPIVFTIKLNEDRTGKTYHNIYHINSIIFYVLYLYINLFSAYIIICIMYILYSATMAATTIHIH